MRLAITKPFIEQPFSRVCALWLFAVMALAAPLFVWFTAQDAFVLPKWVFLQAGTWLLLAAVLIQGLYDRPFRIPLHPINLLFVGFIIWQTISIAWSASPALAADQAASSAMLLLFAFLAQSLLIDDRRRLIALSLLLVTAASIISFWAVAVDFVAALSPGTIPVRQTLFDWRDAIAIASMGNTGHVADFVVLGFLATLAHFLTARRRGVALAAMPLLWLQSAALIVCWSVHSNASLIISSIIFIILIASWMKDRWMKRRLRLLAPLMAGWIIIILFYVIDHPINPHGSSVWGRNATELSEQPSGGIFAHAFSSGRWKEGGPTRLAIWLTSLEMIRENPWLGVGAGNFTYVYPATRSELLMANPDLAPYGSLWTNAAHNSLLQTWSETGVAGLMLLIAVVAAAFYYMNQRRHTGDFGNAIILSTGIAMLAAFCLQAQMNFPLELPISSYVFVLLLSLPVVLPQRRREMDLLMPVRRDYGPLRAGIQLKNMQSPTELHLGINAPPRLALVVGILILLAALYPAWLSTAPLRSSVIYQPMYQALRSPGNFDTQALEAQARRALAVDEDNVDCRSALSDLLVRLRRYDDALAELQIVKQRLNSYEVYLREAISYQQTGRVQEAMVAWNEVFTRRPDMAMGYPREFQMWQQWTANNWQRPPVNQTGP